MHPMVSAPASTLNGLKNVIISCSQKKKKETINRGAQTMPSKGETDMAKL